MSTHTETAAFDALMDEVNTEVDSDLASMLSDDIDDIDQLEMELSEVEGLSDDPNMMASGLAESSVEVAFVGGFIKRKVYRLIRKLVKYARRFPTCTKGITYLRSAIAALKKGKVFSALHKAYRALKAFKSCLAS